MTTAASTGSGATRIEAPADGEDEARTHALAVQKKLRLDMMLDSLSAKKAAVVPEVKVDGASRPGPKASEAA